MTVNPREGNPNGENVKQNFCRAKEDGKEALPPGLVAN